MDTIPTVTCKMGSCLKTRNGRLKTKDLKPAQIVSHCDALLQSAPVRPPIFVEAKTFAFSIVAHFGSNSCTITIRLTGRWTQSALSADFDDPSPFDAIDQVG